MRTLIILVFGLILNGMAWAEEPVDAPDRDPSALNSVSASKRTYPGGADEEDLQVQARLPEAGLKTDARTLQRGVYKTLYNQDLKEERTENVEE
jgi:hypothetical protein